MRVVVIGPSGWLGSAALALLDTAFDTDELRRRVLVFGSHARRLTLPSKRQVDCSNLGALAPDDLDDSVILHFAYLTKDKAQHMSADAYVAANDAIQDCVLRAVAASHPRALFFASSGAVYQGDGGTPSRDSNLYGWMKAQHEAQFEDAAQRAKMALFNGRIFTLSGEYINKVELYALASVLVALRDGGPVRLNAAREVWRSYTYVGDVINLALALLLGQQSSLRFDIAGKDAIEIGDLARLCAKVVGKDEVPIQRPTLSGNPPDRMVGDHSIYYKLLQRENIVPLPLERQIAATASYLGVC